MGTKTKGLGLNQIYRARSIKNRGLGYILRKILQGSETISPTFQASSLG